MRRVPLRYACALAPLLALSGACAGGGLGAPIDVFIPTPPENDEHHIGAGLRAPETASVCNIEVGDSVSEVERRLGGRSIELPREEFVDLYERTRDPALAIALVLGFDRVVVVAGTTTPVFRAYVSGDKIMMMSFVAEAENEFATKARITRRCSMLHDAQPIEDACGKGYQSIDSHPQSYHYFKQGFSIGVTLGTITEIHVYPKLSDLEIGDVQASLSGKLMLAPGGAP
jgi:hypothetical protein